MFCILFASILISNDNVIAGTVPVNFLDDSLKSNNKIEPFKDNVKIIPKNISEKQFNRDPSEEEIIKYIRTVFHEDPDVAVAVFKAESGLNPKAYNPELNSKKLGYTKYSSCGIVQHNDVRCVPYNEDNPSILYDWKYNIDFGYEKWKSRGWKPWGAYTNGSYKKYLQ